MKIIAEINEIETKGTVHIICQTELILSQSK